MVQSVTLFYRETCAECLHARDHLADLQTSGNRAFVPREVSANQDHCAQPSITDGQSGTPVILVDARNVVRLDRLRLDRLRGVDIKHDHPTRW